ncbi:MAG TPA: carboxylating nicotinate-nucleotide diphosphorylase [Bacteroides sp.]|nr:carboxylating nicotinate-nucleotide diphosphorylase [Bacteroides sp.]
MNVFPDLDSAIDRWFAEDIGTGDHTTLGTIPGDATGSVAMLAKEEGFVAGIRVAERIFHRMDRDLKLEISIQDGQAIVPGDTILCVTGKVHSILQCERLVLNVMQRMSGIATTTREYVKLVEGTGARVIDTRKTSPGLRLLEKEAVRLGGGTNHRFGLHDMILIKDNHIDFAGGIRQAIRAVTGYLDTHHLHLPVEVETRSLRDVEEVLSVGGVDRIMLDNFTVEQTREAVKLVAGRYETESSGGITRETIRGYAECGVDYISVGALTHHIKSLDLSLKAEF